MTLTINPDLLAYIDPLTQDEYEALERSLLNEGCRDALVLWGDVLVDGHNRHGICTRHGIAYNTVQNTRFKTLDDVHLWMIDQHLGRRSVSDYQRGVLALRKKDILNSQVQSQSAGEAAASAASDQSDSSSLALVAVLGSREAIAKAARVSSTAITQIEKIQKSAAPELVAAVKSGAISLNAAATVASLPVEAQVAAVAGGRKELQQAARQVRAAKAVARTEPESPEGVIARLQQTIHVLTAENAALKQEIASLR